MNTDRTISVIAIVLLCALGVWWVTWAAAKDDERNREAAAYEACVQREYHMTPIQWYSDHQEYPACGN